MEDREYEQEQTDEIISFLGDISSNLARLQCEVKDLKIDLISFSGSTEFPIRCWYRWNSGCPGD